MLYSKIKSYTQTTNTKHKRKEEKNEIQSIDSLFDDMEVNDNPPKVPSAPKEDEDTYDLQKELEAKFDELFGPLDDE